MKIHPRFISLSLLAAGTLFGQPTPSNAVPGQLLVQTKFGANANDVGRTLSTHGATDVKQIPQLGIHVLKVPEPALPHVQQALSNSGLFTFVERDFVAHAVATPNDP